jgi:hypothetical protein
MWRIVSVGIVAAVVLGVGAGAAAGPSDELFTFKDERIAESSGLASASWSDDVIYTHNDSGDSARFFAVDRTGATVGTYRLDGVRAIDWEDMARGLDDDGKPALFLGDIGDNKASRKEIAVYRVPEPQGPDAALPWVRYRFRYADGPRDAEALLVDPHDGRLYIASKVLFGRGAMYAAPEVLSTTEVNVLEPVGEVPSLVTAGDFSPDGSQVALLTYGGVYVGPGVTGPFTRLTGVRLPQAEGLTYSRDGRSLLISSEGVHASVEQVMLDASVSPPPTAEAPAPTVTADPEAAVAPRDSPWPAAAAAVTIAVLAVITFWAMRRHPH